MDRLTRQEAAAYLKVSPRTLDMWKREDRGPRSYKIVGRVYYLKLDIDAWTQDQLTRSACGGIR
jgi:hypothetical protein